MERKKRKLLGFLRRCKQEARKWWFGYLGGCKQEALEVLKRLRSESEHCIDAGYYHPLKRRLQDVLKEGGLSLADIGTSEEELQILWATGCATVARKWLEHLRSGDDWAKIAVGHLLEALWEGGLSLADIGTSEEELQGLEEKLIRRK